jgi:uncharacterized membrane protein YgcG
MLHRRLISLFLLVAVVVSTAGALVLAPARDARAADAEHIAAYDVTLTAGNDGVLAVKETIAYDFGTNDKHGIFRTIPTREDWDDTYHRVWKLDDIKVTQDGKKAKVETENNNGRKVVQIGDEDKTISGPHTYVISYTVEGAFLPPASKENPSNGIDLAWDAIGTEWAVPIDKATVTMTSPAATPMTCVMGDTGSTQTCARAGSTFTAGTLGAHQGVTVDYRLPAGSVADLGPILRHNVTLAWFFTGSLAGVGAGVVALLAGVAALVVRWRRSGRDSSYVGQIPGLAPVAGQESAVQVGGTGGATSVAFTPPAGVRPAELAMLLNEKTDQRGVTSTLIDLAVHGYLTIEEVDDDGQRRKKPDHRLTRSAKPDDELQSYERELLSGVFVDADTLLLSEQKNGFATVSVEARSGIEKRAVELGWFARKPSSTRALWTVLGAVLSVVGLVAMIAGGQVGWGATGLGVLVVGIVCLAMVRAMPARTALGSAVRADGLAFRRYLETAEADQIRFEEREEIFNRYLPFAIAFDLADHWVSTFQHALAPVAGGPGGSAVPYAAWYVGSGGFDGFNSGLSSFDSGMSSAMTSASSSGGGGGGSVGGGGGGGGGGSW